MAEPYGTLPKLIPSNIQDGYVMRYFIRHISRSDVLEIDKKQYDVFQRNPLYEVFSIKWFILGQDAVTRNRATIDLYTNPSKAFDNISIKMLSALRAKLRSPSELVVLTPINSIAGPIFPDMPKYTGTAMTTGFIPPTSGGIKPYGNS